MAQSQMLYIGQNAALDYAAPGNVDLGSGSKGSISMWYHPCSEYQRGSLLKAGVDANNVFILYRNQAEWNCWFKSGGSTWGIQYVSGEIDWRHITVTWDFSGGPGTGVLRLYLDGEEVPNSPKTGLSAPLGFIETLQIGPGVEHTYTLTRAAYDQLAIWDDVLSAEQASELHAQGRRHKPQETDGSGTLTFLASWDGEYDAEVASGSAAVTVSGESDQYCRLECGSRRDGKRFSYEIGEPSHDQAAVGRVPVTSVLVPLKWGMVTETNTSEWGRLDVEASGNNHQVGAILAPWLPSPEPPMTLRLGLHVIDDGAPEGVPIGVGSHSYYIGSRRRVVCGTGCTTTQIVSDDLTDADGYWDGAELHIVTGSARNEKVRVLTNSQSGQSLTIDGELSDAPEAGNVAMVVRPRRLEPVDVNGHLHRLEADLSQTLAVERFSIVETSICRTQGYTCVNLGRIQVYPNEPAREEILIGKRDTEVYEDWNCSFLVERVEMDGPCAYELVEGTDDTFLVTDPETGESTKARRVRGLVRETTEAEQYPTPSEVQESFTEAGTWRESIRYCPSWFKYDAENDRLIAVLVGEDAGGVQRIGYIHGTWDEQAGLVSWEDDPDSRNPFLAVSDLEAVLGGKSSPYQLLGMVNGVFEVAEDDWALVFTATLGNPDGMAACALTGASDKYSFDPELHFDPELNPLTPAMAGEDKVVPEGGGIGLFGNRDCEPRFVENPWAKDSSERFWGYARAKTINNMGDLLDYQLARPLSCMVTGDFRNLRFRPWRNQVIAPAYGWFHWPHPVWFGPSTLGLVVDDGHVSTSNVSLYASDDGTHLERIEEIVPRLTPPFNASYLQPIANPVRLGDRRLYWYRQGKSGNDFNLAMTRLDGEALYRLDASAVEGELQTCELERSGELWDELKLNVDPKDGEVTVAVVDAETGTTAPGFAHSDCDEIVDGVDRRVSWNGVGLSEISTERIILDFAVTRGSVEDASPELYAWTIASPQEGDRPNVSSLQVEGKANPTKVADPQPELSWEYEDEPGRTQSAYHLLIASSAEKLEANEGDLWDSGVVLSEEPEAQYAGEVLESETTYFWKVRVRNSEGVWSEEW